jgi:hypothetical protein
MVKRINNKIHPVTNPFYVYLTDDGTDYGLNEDYSAGAVDAYWQPASDACVLSLNISTGDTDYAQSIDTAVGFVGSTTPLTNGLKFAVKNPAGTVVTDLTVTFPIKTTAELFAFATDYGIIFSSVSTTSSNNQILYSLEVDCPKKFGGAIYVPAGWRLVCTLQDNLSTASNIFNIGVSGYYAV